MPSIGGFDVLFLSGTPHPGGPSLEDITRKNAAGVSFRQLAATTGPFELRSFVEFSTAAEAHAELDDYQALRGTLISLTTDTGATFSSVGVIKVEPASPIRPVGRVVGGINVNDGDGAWLLECVWTLQLSDVPPGP